MIAINFDTSQLGPAELNAVDRESLGRLNQLRDETVNSMSRFIHQLAGEVLPDQFINYVRPGNGRVDAAVLAREAVIELFTNIPRRMLDVESEMEIFETIEKLMRIEYQMGGKPRVKKVLQHVRVFDKRMAETIAEFWRCFCNEEHVREAIYDLYCFKLTLERFTQKEWIPGWAHPQCADFPMAFEYDDIEEALRFADNEANFKQAKEEISQDISEDMILNKFFQIEDEEGADALDIYFADTDDEEENDEGIEA